MKKRGAGFSMREVEGFRGGETASHSLLDREQIAAVLDRDGVRVLQHGCLFFAFLMVVETVTHATDPNRIMSLFPAASAGLMLGVSALFWRKPDFMKPWAFLVLCCLVPSANISLHFSASPFLSLIFLTMSALTTGALYMPLPAILVSLPGTILLQAYCAFRVWPEDPASPILIALFTATISILLNVTRRQSLLASERARVFEQRLNLQLERTHRLEQERLEQAIREAGDDLASSHRQLEAKERLAALGTLSAGIAHQLNNPLGAILTSADFAILNGEGPEALEESRQTLVAIRENAVRCGKIVRSVLQFSRSEVVEKWSHDFSSTLRTAIALTRDYARECGTEIQVGMARDVEKCTAWMNPIEIEEVFVNLIRNAIEANAGRGQVRIRVELCEPEVEVSIEDDGPGVAPELRSRIFDPFYTTRLAEGGSGLGLAVAHRIVDAHQGRLWLDESADPGDRSRKRTGARFKLRLPLERLDEGPVRSQE